MIGPQLDHASLLDGRAPTWSRLSAEQLRFYFLHQLDPADPDIYICRVLRVAGPLDVAQLRAAVAELGRRHDILRGCIVDRDGEPVIVLRDEVDAAFVTASDDDVALREAFDLAEGPLFRVTAIRLGEHSHVVVLRFHHLIADGASVQLFLAELWATYRGDSRARPRHQYRDFVEWEARRSADPARADDRAFWAKKLAQPTVLDLAPGKRPERHTRAAGTVYATASPDLVATLRATCKSLQVTPYLVMLAVFQILLHQRTGKRDVLVGTPIAARPRLEHHAMLGVLVNWIAFRAQLAPESTFRDLVLQLRADAPDAYSRQCSYEALLAAAGNPPRDAARNPLFQVTLNYATQRSLVAPPGLAITVDPIVCRETPYDLAVRCEEIGDALRIELTYYRGVLDEAGAQELAAQLLALAERCLASPDAPIGTPAPRIAIAATFTAEPLVPVVEYWLELVGLRCTVELAPIDQVFQTVLADSAAVTVLLVRSRDWRDPSAAIAELRAHLLARTGNTIVIECPPSDGELGALAADRIHVVPWRAIAERYPVAVIDEPAADADARAPYSEDGYVALGTAVARAIHAALRPPPKVLVLDCDDTLWSGVVGEDGAGGLAIDEGRAALQRFALAQRDAGILLALASKNNPADVWEAFEHTPGMLLREDMIVAHRINWEPKSRSLRALAAELNLGLDAFAFIDDSPAECAEVRAACPGVLVLQLPAPDAIARFLAHLWPFDPRARTAIDRKRSELYLANAQREQLRSTSADLAAFIASLELRIELVPFSPEVAPRIAQLTQRTNQFNTTTIRRTEAELHTCGAEILVVDVADRFGDYGIVGAAFYTRGADALVVDSLLLSCRALGRGVEQRMLAELGRIAERAGLAAIELAFRATSKNRPAARFLEAFATRASADCYRIAAADALAAPGRLVVDGSEPAEVPVAIPEVAPERWSQIANELADVAAIRAAIAKRHARPRPVAIAYVAPRDPVETAIARAWAEVLHVDVVGATDDYFAIGGDSIRSLAVVSRLRRAGLPVAVQDLHAHPTVAGLAAAIRERTTLPQSSPVLTTSGAYALAFSQRYVIDAYARENHRADPSGAYHLQHRLAITEPVGHDVDALQRAIDLLVARTPLLRTQLIRGGLQLERAMPAAFEVVDLPAAEVMRRDRMRPFDPEHGHEPMMRFYAIARTATELELIVTAHHGFCDGWSLQSFYNQLFALYDALRRDDTARAAAIDAELAAREHAFRELVDREQRAPASDAFWRAYLAERRVAQAPRPDDRVGIAERIVVPAPWTLVERASRRARESRTSLKAVLLEAFATALGAAAVLAVVTNGRKDDLAAPTEVFGLCWTFVPIVAAPGDRGARLVQLHRDLVATEAHARYPVEAMFGGRDPRSVAHASFNLTNFHNARWQRATAMRRVERVESFHRFHFPLDIDVILDEAAQTIEVAASSARLIDAFVAAVE